MFGLLKKNLIFPLQIPQPQHTDRRICCFLSTSSVEQLECSLGLALGKGSNSLPK